MKLTTTLLALAASLLTTAAASPPHGNVVDASTVVELLTTNPQGLTTTYIVKGLSAVGDPLGGAFYYDSASAQATNALSVFAWGTGRLSRITGVGATNVFDTIIVTNALIDLNLTPGFLPYADTQHTLTDSPLQRTDATTVQAGNIVATNQLQVVSLSPGQIYLGGYSSATTNYARLMLTHTGTNGSTMFDSQSAGIAGNPRPFVFETNTVPVAAIDTTGALLVGKTAPSGWMGFSQNYSLISISDKDAGETGINTEEQEAYNAGSSSTNRYSSFVTKLASASNTNLVTAGITMLARAGVIGAIRDYGITLSEQNGTASTNTAWGVGPYLIFNTTRTGGGSTNYMSLWPSMPNTNSFSAAGITSPYNFDTESEIDRLPYHTQWRHHGTNLLSLTPQGGLVYKSVTKAQKTALTPIDGTIVYQSDNTPGFRAYVSGTWVIISTAADP